MNIHQIVHEISHLKQYNQFWKLANDLENGVMVTKGQQNILNSLDCPKGIAVLVWSESRQRFKRYINFSEIFTYLNLPVTFKIRSGSPKSNQLLSLSQIYIHASLVKFQPLVQEILWIQEIVTQTLTQ